MVPIQAPDLRRVHDSFRIILCLIPEQIVLMYRFDCLDSGSIASFQNIFNYTTCQTTSKFDMPYYLDYGRSIGYDLGSFDRSFGRPL